MFKSTLKRYVLQKSAKKNAAGYASTFLVETNDKEIYLLDRIIVHPDKFYLYPVRPYFLYVDQNDLTKEFLAKELAWKPMSALQIWDAAQNRVTSVSVTEKEFISSNIQNHFTFCAPLQLDGEALEDAIKNNEDTTVYNFEVTPFMLNTIAELAQKHKRKF